MVTSSLNWMQTWGYPEPLLSLPLPSSLVNSGLSMEWLLLAPCKSPVEGLLQALNRGQCTQKQRPPHIELTVQHNHQGHQDCKKDHQSSASMPSSVSGPCLPLWGDLKGPQAVGAEAQRSILIPMAFTLSWQPSPQNRSQIPQPAKSSTKATPRSFACRGEAIPHPVHSHRQNAH